MTIRAYYARYLELNKYLPQFPPFNDNQKISEDEIKEHAEFAIPNSWQRQMTMHGFHMVDHTINEFIKFCEQLEVSEDIFDSTHKKSQKTNAQRGRENGTQSSMTGGKTNSGKKRKDFSNHTHKCLYHGDNNTHDTNDCKVMKKQAANMAASHTGRGGKNKWNRSEEQESKEKKKLQYQSFVADVAHQVKKKHKSDKKTLASKEFETLEWTNSILQSLGP